MLQTRSRYAKYERSYSQNRLNKSKFSISVSIVIIATIIIKTCYGVQRFKPDVSALNMKEDIAIWNLLIYKTKWLSIPLYTLLTFSNNHICILHSN